MKLPESFMNDMKALLGSEYDRYIASYKEPRWYGLRVNTHKISVEDFLAISPFKLRAIPWIENGFYYNGEVDKPGKHPYYFAGLYYLQEPSAMTPAHHLPINPGDKVLDLCAAPGGKTTELGAKLKGEGVLVSNDISNSRARILLKNQELLGLTNIYVMSENPQKMLGIFPEYFDKILVDAPCSGEGMFRKDSKMVKMWEETGPDVYADIQKTLITQAAAMLKPGGMILYSTCTFNQEENEGTIAHLLKEYPQFRVVKQKEYEGFRPGITKRMSSDVVLNQSNTPGEFNDMDKSVLEVDKYSGLGLEDSLRLWPQYLEGEGHYLCLVEKTVLCLDDLLNDDSTNSTVNSSSMLEYCSRETTHTHNEKLNAEDRDNGISLSSKKKFPVTKISEDLREFFKEVSWELDMERLRIVGEKVYLLPGREGILPISQNNESQDIIIPETIKKLRLLRNGLLLGELKKNRFEPSQAFAMSLECKEYSQVIDFAHEDIRVMKYLKGETIDVEDCTERKDKGWYLVAVNGYPLGWAKLANQTLKNKYQVGWRLQS